MKAELKRKKKTGIVVSNAMDKSVVVQVERTFMDPIFKKHMRKKRKFMAHDEGNACGVGDTVLIRETRPISKRKRWRVEAVISKTRAVE